MWEIVAKLIILLLRELIKERRQHRETECLDPTTDAFLITKQIELWVDKIMCTMRTIYHLVSTKIASIHVDSPDEILQTQGWLDAYTTASHASKIMTED